jgi:outer membrane lipoprotein SlyB
MPMNTAIKTHIVVLLAALSMTGCASTPETTADPYNSADSQRSRAQQAQDELSSETSGQE